MPFRKIIVSFLVAVGLISLAQPAAAAPGDTDLTYTGKAYGPISPIIRAVALQPDGKLILGGYMHAVYGTSLYPITRLNPEGSVDQSFILDTDIRSIDPYSVAVLDNGQILVGGSYRYSPMDASAPLLKRLNSNGSLDPSFTTVIADGVVYGMAVQPDGKVLAGGTFQKVNGTDRPYLVRLNADGSLDESFQVTALNDAVQSLAVQPDGKVVVGGLFTAQVAGSQQRGIVRLNASGSLDESFTVSLKRTTGYGGTVSTLSLLTDGRILASGFFDTVNGQPQRYLVCLNTQGQPQPTTGASESSLSLIPQCDGNFLITGDYPLSDGGVIVRQGIIQRPVLGSSSVFNARLTTTSLSAIIQKDGRLVATIRPPQSQFNVAANMLFRLENSPATENLSVSAGGSKITWLRGGTSPELTSSYFELSTDDGASWQALGAGSKIAGGWELDGLTLPAQGDIRARGRYVGGFRNGSSSLLESRLHLMGGSPQLVLEGPAGDNLPATNAAFDFGNQRRASKTFLVKNTGTAPLQVNEVILTDPTHYTLDTTNLPSIIQAGSQGSFEVTFMPSTEGTLQSQIRISTNDPGAAARTVQLTGTSIDDSNTNLQSISFRTIDLQWGPTPLNIDIPIIPGWNHYTFYAPYNTRHIYVELTPPFRSSLKAFIPGQEHYEVSSNFGLVFDGNHQTVRIEITSPDQSSTQSYFIHLSRLPAKPGDVDLTFTGPSDDFWQGQAYQILMATDGKIRTAIGVFGEIQSNGFYELDSVGNPTLIPGLSGIKGFHSVLPYPSDHILSGGSIQGQPELQNSLTSVRDLTGTYNLSFKTPGIYGSTAGQHVLPDNKVLLWTDDNDGYRLSGTATPLGQLIRLMPDGNLDPSFQSVGLKNVKACAVEPDGGIVVSGQLVSPIYPHLHLRIIRLKQDGSLAEVQPSHQPAEPVQVIENAPDGKWIILGNFSIANEANQKLVTRYNADWSLDTSFNKPTSLPPRGRYSLAVQSNGALIVAGIIPNQPAYPILDTNISKIQLNGQFDQTFTNRLPGGAILELALQRDGKVIVVGSFSQINGLERHNIARLTNEAATEELTVPSADRIQWLRGGSMPEARRVFFELSTDGGQTWTKLREATRIPGGWEATGADLPRTGQVRGRAVIGMGINNRSTGLMGSDVVAFEFGPPEIAVFQSDSQLQSGSSDVSFADVVTKTGVGQLSLRLTNSGATTLEDFQVRILGPQASAFQVVELSQNSVATGASGTLTLAFAPAAAGNHTATLEISSNAQTTPVFSLTLSGTGLAQAAPAITTKAAEQITHQGGRLFGSLSAVTDDQQLWFEYGPTKTLGQVAAAEVVEAESGTYAATISDLQPHTPYFYRIVTRGPLGAAQGKTLSFTTLNRAPTGLADSYRIVPGCTVIVNPLDNDSDADRDTLKIHSVSSMAPASAGKVAKGANGLTVSLSSSASAASFTYRVADAFGGVSADIHVHVTAAQPGWYPTHDLSAYEQTLFVGMTYDVRWSMNSHPSWAVPEMRSGIGFIRFRVQANSGKNARTGVVKVGVHTLTINQEPGGPPILGLNADPVQATIGNRFTFGFFIDNGPAKLSAKNLPPGLVLNQGGDLSGIPTKAGNYSVEINASNVFGKAEPLTFDINVQAFPEHLTGAFEGYFVARDSDDMNLTGRYQLRVQKNGAFSGKLQFGKRSLPIKGYVDVLGGSNEGRLLAEYKSDPELPGPTWIYISPTSVPTISLNRDAREIPLITQGYSIPWNGKDKQATAYQGLHTFTIEPPFIIAGSPAGYGFGSANITAKTGMVRLTGRLPDGTAFTTSSALGQPHGQQNIAPLSTYLPLYKNNGYYAGGIQVTPGATPAENIVTGTAYWSRPPSADRLYPEGFSRYACTIRGSALPAIAPGNMVLGAAAGPANAVLEFSQGGLPSDENLDVTLTNPSPKGIVQKAVVGAGDTLSATLPKLDAKTGLFSGQIVIPGATKAQDRKLPYVGQIVRFYTTQAGYGQFLLPELPSAGQSAKTTRILSGRVMLKTADP